MSDILKFACPALNCGRKFNTQEALNTHFNLRHPEPKKEKENKPSIEKIIKQISKPKLNPQEKHHFLQPITKRKSQSKIVNNKEIKENKNRKEIIEEDIDLQDIPFSREEKEKKLLNNLFGQINNLENYLQEDFEFHKEFKLPDVPDYDTMYDSDEEKKENINNKKKENKNIYEITEEMIFSDISENKKEYIDDEKYKKIHELNLNKKNIINFENKKNISFEKLQELYVLNLSDNLISEANDIKYFENLRELYMNNNKLVEISFCEFLPNLIILNLENNNIISITSLNICVKLKVLKLRNNKIKYVNSTLRTFKNLKNLEEITIKQNIFLEELFSYREYFVSNYKNIKKFDEENITEEKRQSAEIFYKENNPLYKSATKRPMSSRHDKKNVDKTRNNDNINLYDIFEDNSDNNIDDDFNEVMMYKTQINFRAEDKMNINNFNKNKKLNNEKEENKDNKNIINEEKTKNEEEETLKKMINEQKLILDKLRNELDHSSQLNKEYEIKIEQYKNELNYESNNISENKDEETEKIKKELEMWKKQYFDLLEKNLSKEEKDIKFSKDLFDKNNKIRKNQMKRDIIERPQTAQARSNITRDFKKLYEEINILEGDNNKDKNIFEDVLNEESDEEEEEENKDDKENEEIEDEKNVIKEEIEDEIPDDEIEEMFRKSYQDIQKMRKDLQEINNNIDGNINKNNNIENILNNDKKGNKLALKPLIIKKENNKNSVVGNPVFVKRGNKLTGKDNNKNENNKNSSAQKYNELLYKLKK